MIRQPLPRHWVIALGVASFLILAICYTALSVRQRARNPIDTTMPGWTELGRGLMIIFTPDEFEDDQRPIVADTKASLSRLFTGLSLGILISIVIGTLMGCFSTAEAVFLPPLSFLAKIPLTAMLAVFFVIAGTGFQMYVLMLIVGTVPTLAQSIHQGARKDVPDELVYKAYTLGATSTEVIWNVIIRQVLPRMLEAIRLSVGPAMVYLVAAEWLNADSGFGYRLRTQSRLLDMKVVYCYLVYLGLLGLGIDFAITYTRRWFCPWFGK